MSMREEFIRLQESLDKIIEQKEKGIIKDYKEALNELRATIATAYAKYEVAGVLLFAEMMKYNRATKLDKEIQAILKELGRKYAQNTRDIMKLVYTESFDRTKNLVEIATDRRIPGIIKDEVLKQAIENPVKGLKLSRTLEKNRVNIIYTIQQTVEQGLKNGETYGQMAGRLKDSLENDVPKALRIVRTETHRVMEQAKLDYLGQGQAAGLEIVKVWVSSRDERVRSSHTSMDGITVDYDKDFDNPLTGGKGPGPGMMGTAEDDINCRCIFTIDIKGITDGKTGLAADNSGRDDTGPGQAELVKTVDFSDKKQVQLTLESYEKEIVKQDFETAVIVTNFGEVYRVDGTAGRVHPEVLGEKLRGAHVTHNHPISETEFSFSDDDLTFFDTYQLQVLRGIDVKYIYELNRSGKLDELRDVAIKEMTEEEYRHRIVHHKAKLKGYGYKRWKNE